jgi:hypothetical protein
MALSHLHRQSTSSDSIGEPSRSTSCSGVRRAALILLVACDAGAHEDVAKPPVANPVVAPVAKPPVAKPAVPPPPTPPEPAQPTNPVTKELPPSAIASLTGCWRHDRDESWTFRPDGKHGLIVVRELRDSFYADRARIPEPVSYDPTSKTFGFGAAGRIHGLMMLFQIEHDTLKTSVYSSHERGSYAWTGNTWTLKRC